MIKIKKKIFRFDDICINADMDTVNKMTDHLIKTFPKCDVIWGISPLVHDMSNSNGKAKQRIFPEILNAHSDHRLFFNVDKANIPKLRSDIILAGHGLIHVDHRLLTKEQQEMSILISCSLVKAKMFIPPFNKWNIFTDQICKEHGIELIKFEDGWKCMEYNKYNDEQNLWYLHHREFTIDQFENWFTTNKEVE
jgi:hypothetical protein